MTIYSYAYSDSYDPAAPVVEIAVHSPLETDQQVWLSVLIDTGADVTTLPLRLLSQIGAEYVETATLTGIAGGRVVVDLYRVSIRIGSQTIPGIRVAGVLSSTNAVLGRDVLNYLVVSLHGPANVTEIEG